MEFYEVINTRRSIRQFEDREIPKRCWSGFWTQA